LGFLCGVDVGGWMLLSCWFHLPALRAIVQPWVGASFSGGFGLGYSEKVPVATGSRASGESAFQCLCKGGGWVPTATASRKLCSGMSTWKRAEACCFLLFCAEQSANVQPNPHTPHRRRQTCKPQPQMPINPTTQGNNRTISRGAIVSAKQQVKAISSLNKGYKKKITAVPLTA
jgi:hypothetical protein